MPRKKTETKPNNKATIMLQTGTVLGLPKEHTSPYKYIAIISDKELLLQDKVVRECVAWNADRCRRYDSFEEDLQKYKEVGKITEDIQTYRQNNKTDTWREPKIPKTTLDSKKG